MTTSIVFTGTHKIGKVQNLVFNIVTDKEEKQVLVPVDQKIADHILRSLQKFTHVDVRPVERGNDEPQLDST